MKIVHLIDYFQPKVGYQEFFLAREQVKAGHDVHVVTSDRYFPFPHYERIYESLMGKRIIGSGHYEELGVSTVRLPTIEIVPGSIVILKNLFPTLDNLAPDLVFCHNMYSFTTYRAARLKKKCGYSLIFDSHAASFNTNFSRSFLSYLYHSFYMSFAAPLIKKEANAIFAVGEMEREFIVNDYKLKKEDVSIVRCGVDIEQCHFDEKKRNLIRKKLGLVNSDILLINTGKLTPNKDIDTLVKAVAQLGDSRVHVLFIGGWDETYKKHLQSELVSISVHEIPTVLNVELGGYYSAADIAIWPGDPSGSILEAMACRKPIILPESLETAYLNNSFGIARFKRKNVEILKNVLKMFVNNSKIRDKYGKSAELFINNNLSWEKLSKQAISLLEINKK